MDTKLSDNRSAVADAIPSEIYNVAVPMAAASDIDVVDSASVFDEDAADIVGRPVPGYPGYTYMPFGGDNLLPFHLIRTIGGDEVLSQNLYFNILTQYCPK